MLDDFFYSAKEIRRSFREFHSRKRADAFTPDSRGEPSLIGLIQNYELLLKAAMKAIREGEYQLGPGKAFTIAVDKDRIIYHFNWLDTFILYHFARSLASVTENILPDSVFSYRQGKSAGKALALLKTYIRANSNRVFVVRRDVSNFGEEMAHSFLIEDLQRYASPSDALTDLFKQICAFKQLSEEGLIENKLGLPGGHYLQLICENLYLLELDHKMESAKPGCYLRFGDDILFVSPVKEIASSGASIIDEHLSARKISANPLKSKDFELIDPNIIPKIAPTSSSSFIAASNFSYLGSQVFWNGQLSIPSKKLSVFRSFFRRRIKAACKAVPASEGAEVRLAIAIDSVSNLCSGKFLAHHEDSPLKMIFQEVYNETQLRELDRWLALLTLKIAMGKGFKKGYFRLYSPATLRKLGLPSLLHLRRTRGLR